MKLSEIAAFLGGELAGDPDLNITGLARIEEAAAGDLSFLANPKYAKYLSQTKASAVLVDLNQEQVPIAHIRLSDPYLGFVKIAAKINPPKYAKLSGIHKTAVIADSAHIDKSATIGALVYIGENVRIGKNTIIYPGCVVLDNSSIGDDCVLYPNVSIREACKLGRRVILHNGVVIGSDGFGFAPEEKQYIKIPQLGNVIIEDDVEIGANSCVDRATLGGTVIRRGTKLDNMVQIAHNVDIGDDTVIAAQSGVAGSSKIGKHVTIAGQVGRVGHIHIEAGAMVAAKSGVAKASPKGEVWFGYPAAPIMKMKKIEASLRHLPELTKKIHNLEKTIIELEEKLKNIGHSK